MSEQFQYLIEKYHTVRTVPKSNKKNATLSEQFQNLNSQRIVISDASLSHID